MHTKVTLNTQNVYKSDHRNLVVCVSKIRDSYATIRLCIIALDLLYYNYTTNELV